MGSPKSGSRRFALRRSHCLLGISIPESRSGLLALRRSSRLLGKPAMNLPPQFSPRKPCIASKLCTPSKPLKRTGIYRKLTSAEITRHNLEFTVLKFPNLPTVKSTGFSWVCCAGYGLDMCCFLRKTRRLLYARIQILNVREHFITKIGFTKPFAVVCVTSGTSANVHEVSSSAVLCLIEEQHLANINTPGNGVYIEEQRFADISCPDTQGLAGGAFTW